MAEQEVQMFLDDPNKSVILGVPPNAETRKINNPFYYATELDKEGRRADAEKIYNELFNNDFENPALIGALGMCFAANERTGLAHLLLQEALKRVDGLMEGFARLGITPKPGYTPQLSDFTTIKKSELLNAIGTCYKHENRTKEARHYFEQAQSLIPLNSDIQNNLGTLFINEGKPTDAFRHLDAAIGVDPQHPQAHWNRSLAYLELGDYARGWPEYDWGITAKVRVERQYTKENQPPLPYWKGEKGARLVVYGEQGIGDEIMFVSMLPDLLRDCELVVFECHRKLHKLFANSFPGLDIYPTREDEMVAWPLLENGKPRYPLTHRIAVGSLGQFYRNDINDFPGTPYIHPTAAAEKEWADWLATLPPGPKIGLSWMGGHKKTRVEVRSIALNDLAPIVTQKGATFVSLQYTPHEDELKAFEEKHGVKVHMAPKACYSGIYDDTAGLVANLDLVITVCTSVVHLAGSMGVPTWVMTPSRPAWRYRLDLDGMPWYNSVSLYRQDEGSTDWKPVIDRVAAALADLLSSIQPQEKANGNP